MKNQFQTKFEVHYYFDDDSHSMNAFVRNKAEKDMLEAIRQIGFLLDSDVSIETEAYQEGGLKEFLIVGGVILGFMSPSINDVITHYFIKGTDTEHQLDIKIKEETLKGLRLDNIKKEEDQKKLEKEINDKLEDKQTIRYVSNFYTKVNSYTKIKQIGFRDVTNDTEEYIVRREQFKNFILEEDKEIIEDDNANIEIISPILKEGKFKWKGLYIGEKIDFSMGDSAFKQEVINSKHTFSNGSFIECNLQITIIYDEFGDEKRRSYSVKKVYGIQDIEQGKLKLRKSGLKRQRDKWINEHYGSLFNEEDFKE